MYEQPFLFTMGSIISKNRRNKDTQERPLLDVLDVDHFITAILYVNDEIEAKKALDAFSSLGKDVPLREIRITSSYDASESITDLCKGFHEKTGIDTTLFVWSEFAWNYLALTPTTGNGATVYDGNTLKCTRPIHFKLSTTDVFDAGLACLGSIVGDPIVLFKNDALLSVWDSYNTAKIFCVDEGALADAWGNYFRNLLLEFANPDARGSSSIRSYYKDGDTWETMKDCNTFYNGWRCARDTDRKRQEKRPEQ